MGGEELVDSHRKEHRTDAPECRQPRSTSPGPSGFAGRPGLKPESWRDLGGPAKLMDVARNFLVGRTLLLHRRGVSGGDSLI